MADPTSRSWLVTVPTLGALFLGGCWLGLALAEWAAPGSILATFAGFFMLPAAFLAGFQLWLGVAIFWAILKLLKWLVKRDRPFDGGGYEARVPPGSWVFVLTSLLSSAICGFLVALTASQMSFLATLGLFLGVGFAYGVGCWLLARNGYLPFPDE